MNKRGIYPPFVTCLLSQVAYALWFFFKRYVVRHIRYSHSLASQPCTHWDVWGTRASYFVCTLLLFRDSYIWPPYYYLHRLGNLPLSGVYTQGINSSWFLFQLYAEVPIELICMRACLALNFHSLFFGFDWSYCNRAMTDSRCINIFLHGKGESLEVWPST